MGTLIQSQGYSKISADSLENEASLNPRMKEFPAYMFGLNLSINQNRQIYSEGPFNTKELLGFGGGVINQFNINSFMDLAAEVNYEFLRTPSFAGEIRLHNINVPVSAEFFVQRRNVRFFVKAGGYYTYSMSGQLYTDEINWEESGYSRDDYGALFGFGFLVQKFKFDFSFSYGFPGFYSEEPMFFMNIGAARNNKAKLTLSYFLTN